MTQDLPEEKSRAAAWFRALRDEIVHAFEEVETRHEDGPRADQPAGRFELRDTKRTAGDGSDAGGGLMSVMRNGRVFEKVGVNVSEVHGTLSPAAQKSMAARGVPGIAENPSFWASGISLVAHMQNPHVPAVHMNTRMFWTPEAWWFGGGADLNPCLEYDEDTAHFHGTLQSHLDPHDPALYPDLKRWADEYFYIPHRGRARGVGGIFYDNHFTGDWEKDFAFTQEVGKAFVSVYPDIARDRMNLTWSSEQRLAQRIKRGRYVEFNLLHDRGTIFGLKTGGNVEAILMSLPPDVAWP